MSKRVLSLGLAALLLFALLCGCSQSADPQSTENTGAQQREQPTQEKRETDSSRNAPAAKPTGRQAAFEPVETGFYTNDERIRMIEINQALSYGLNSDNGNFYVMENFVAGKETAVFVSFNEAINFDSYDYIILNIERDGELVLQVLPYILDEYTLYFQPKSMTSVDNWEQGAYTFTFEMDDIYATRTANFFESITVKILAVPIIGNYSGEIIKCGGAWQYSSEMLYGSFPIGRANLEYVLGPELDLSDSFYDLDDDDGMYEVWWALSNLQTPNNDYTMILGFIPENCGGGSLLGYTYGAPGNIIVESSSDMLATVVHEIAHCYNIGDEYDGGSLNPDLNSPPYGMQGRRINTGESVSGVKPAVLDGRSQGLSGTGAVIYAEQRPFWPEGRRLLGSVSSFMGAGTDSDSFTMWVTSDIWNHLYSVLVGRYNTPGSPSNTVTNDDDDYDDDYDDDDHDDYWGQCPACYADVCYPEFYAECWYCEEFTEIYDFDDAWFECWYCEEEDEYDEETLYIYCYDCDTLISLEYFFEENGYYDSMSGREVEAVKVIDITGFVGEGGKFYSDPWYTYESDPSSVTANKSGEYGVYFYDMEGGLISSSNFDPIFTGENITSDGIANINLHKAPVSITTKFPDKASSIEVRRGDTVLYSVDVSTSAPEIEFVGLDEYEVVDNIATLEWDGYDADGDTLYYELWYCPSEDEFYNVASNITETSYTLDLTDYPGTEEGYFYIYATDGVLTSENASPWVQVPFKAPSILSDPDGIQEYKITDEILLDADVYDTQDGWLIDEGVKWLLDGNEYMNGCYLWVWPYELTPGRHTFTLLAENSGGLISTKEFVFNIINDESDLPNDWSREEISEALSEGFVLPLNKLDSAVTRGQFANLMSSMYFYLVEDGYYPEYEEGVVTDCGWDDYDQFLMVNLGLMEVKDGRFEPNRPLTELDAMTIMYGVITAADPDLADVDIDIEDIIEILYDCEVLDDSGPNIYVPERNQSSKLSLVRVNRLITYIYG